MTEWKTLYMLLNLVTVYCRPKLFVADKAKLLNGKVLKNPLGKFTLKELLEK